MNKQELKRTAYHEAGHALAAYLLRRRFRYVTIVPTEFASGHVATWLPENIKRELGVWLNVFEEGFRPIGMGDWRDITISPKIITTVQTEMIILAAGNAAEVRFTKDFEKREAGSFYVTSLEDMELFHRLAVAVTLTEPEAYAFGEWINERTWNLIGYQWHWKAVEALAKALLKKPHIEYKEAVEIMASTFAANADKAQQAHTKEMNTRFKLRASVANKAERK